jgi:hypothetical protein
MLRISAKTFEPTMNPTAIDIVSAFRTFHGKVFSFESKPFQTVFMKALGPSKNHVFVFRNPGDIPLNNFLRRVIVLNIVSEKSSKRGHGLDKQRAFLNVTGEKRGRCGRCHHEA